jgi:hypothetical protein
MGGSGGTEKIIGGTHVCHAQHWPSAVSNLMEGKEREKWKWKWKWRPNGVGNLK